MNQNEKFELMQRLPPAAAASTATPPEFDITKIHQLVANLRTRTPASAQHPGPSNLVLFTGPSGTGKTMAAQALAQELGSEVYRVDTSRVVSKYIGETEKNLSAIFARAATSTAILFFDEADSLFGKRSEVKDSHDRYANIEANFLLQQAKAHPGIVILACNEFAPLDVTTNQLEFH